MTLLSILNAQTAQPTPWAAVTVSAVENTAGVNRAASALEGWPIAKITASTERLAEPLAAAALAIESLDDPPETYRLPIMAREPLAQGAQVSLMANAIDAIGRPAARALALESMRPKMAAVLMDKTPLLGEPAAATVNTIEDLEAVTVFRRLVNAVEPMADPVAQFPITVIDTPSTPPEGQTIIGKWELYIDGIPCRSRITGCRVEYDEGFVHNKLSISTADISLYNQADPKKNTLENRVELHIGNRVLVFVIDARRVNDERSYSIKCYSPSIGNNEEFNPGWAPPEISDPVTALDFLSAGMPYGPVTWSVPVDPWLIYSDDEIPDNPTDTLSRIAGVVSAVARCADDGAIDIRRLWPAGPADFDDAPPVLRYEREDIVNPNISAEFATGEGITSIQVTNQDTAGITLPDMEIEESSPIEGDTTHIRVYWENGIPPEPIDTDTTSGKMVSLGMATRVFPTQTGDEPEYERIEFKEGKATLPRPVTHIRSIRWIGRQPGNITFEPLSKDLILDDGLWGIADIIYESTYHRYQINSPQISALMAILGFYGSGNAGLSVTVKTPDEPEKAADTVSDLMIRSEPVAIERGTAELWARKYDKLLVSFTAPYRDECIDGAVIHINDPLIDVVGAFKITRANIELEEVAMWNQVECERCLM